MVKRRSAGAAGSEPERPDAPDPRRGKEGVDVAAVQAPRVLSYALLWDTGDVRHGRAAAASSASARSILGSTSSCVYRIRCSPCTAIDIAFAKAYGRRIDLKNRRW